jgi:hypothetical protein
MLILLILTTLVPIANGMPGPRRRWPIRPRFDEIDPETLERIADRIATMTRWKIGLSTVNLILYAYISAFYIRLYRENDSNFSLSLAGLSLVLLVYSISSNPLILWYLGRTDRAWLAAFDFIPDLFSTLAAIILISISRT